MTQTPMLISVDDHVFEPPDLWQQRLPAKYRDRGPRLVPKRLRLAGGEGGGEVSRWVEDPDGSWGWVWIYDDLFYPLVMLYAAVGFEEVGFGLLDLEAMRPGVMDPVARLEDMAANHVEAALSFPNTLPRFCGQTFLERADKELALLCLRAYNDWVIEDWCGGEAKGRLIPVTLIPLWDPVEAAAEVRRCAAKGSFAITFPENPHPLGLPTVHEPGGYWDPVFQACQDTETTMCIHIGSSSKMPTTSPSAPFIVGSVITFSNSMGSLVDLIFSGVLERFPGLKVAYAEGQIGWLPYVIERADALWKERTDNSFGTSLAHAPSSFIPDRIYGCIFDDLTALRNRDVIGMDQICFETDYPHADSTWPESRTVFEHMVKEAGMADDEIYKLARGNAIKAFGLHRFGIDH